MIPQPLLARLRAGTRFLLTSHVNPDGDAIGSELGLARVLGALGKRARIWNRDAAPALYAPLPGADRIHVGPEPPADFPGGTDAVIVLECPSLERTGLEGAFGGLPLINIDHHLGNQHYGAVNWVEPAAPAVGVMVHELAVALGATVGDDAASCLYLALVTDTGGFRFANATAPAFEAAARLVAAGANVERVSHWLYESQPEPSIRLLGELLATLARHDGGRVATVSLDLEAFARAGAAPGDSEGLIDVPRSIAGVEAVALLRELPGGEWKISLRSRGAVDVAAVAASRGGGGHKNAAGCRADGALTAVRDSVVADLARAVGAVHDS